MEFHLSAPACGQGISQLFPTTGLCCFLYSLDGCPRCDGGGYDSLGASSPLATNFAPGVGCRVHSRPPAFRFPTPSKTGKRMKTGWHTCGNGSGGSTIKSILRKIGNYIPVVCGAGTFNYGGIRVSGSIASVGLYQIRSADTGSGYAEGPFTDITFGEGVQGGYGYATYNTGEKEHFLFGGVGGDVG